MARSSIAVSHKRRPRAIPSAAAWLLLAGAVACQKEDEHPPLAPGCVVNCTPIPPVSIGIGSAGGSASTPDGGVSSGKLMGNVTLYTNDTFKVASAFTGSALVSAEGATVSSVSSTWDGSQPFALSAVKVTDTNWVGVKPDDTSLAFWTYHAVQTNAVERVDLPLVQTTTLQQVYSALTVSTQPATGSGQVILTLFDAATQAPFSGLRVVFPAAQFIAYSENGSWSEDDTATTGNTGLVILGNVTVGASSLLSVSLTGPASTKFDVRAVPNAVTVVSVNVRR